MTEVKVTKDRYIADSLYQYDYNQDLVIYGLSLPSIPEIHFANSVLTEAIVKQATMDDAGVIRVDIPNEILTYPNDIDAYVCIYEADAFRVLYKITIPVEPKKKPADYIAPDDETIYSYNALENKLENTLKISLDRYDEINRKYEEINETYNQALETLEESIEEVNEAKESVSRDADSAFANATLSTANKLASAESAELAKTSATNAATSERNARGEAQTSAAYANSAQTNATNAANSAEEAKNAQDNACEYMTITKDAMERVLSANIPDYVVDEATKVADKIIAKRSANSLVLLMATDLHRIVGNVAGSADNATSIEHLGMGMAEIRKQTSPDAVILLGDYVYDAGTLDKELCKTEMKALIGNLYDATNGITSVWLNGNHDYYRTTEADKAYRLTDGEQYALIGANNSKDTVVDSENLVRNYGYVDFDKQRIRLIYMNTTDISGDVYSPNYISNTQGQWFINVALDLSDKADEEKWGVVICTHFPINMYSLSDAYYGTPIFPDLVSVLSNFKDKASGTNYDVNYDFSTSKAELIANFHGHIHNTKVNEVTTAAGNIIKVIAIPNGCINRENPYGGDFAVISNEAVFLEKELGTGKDTSFNAIVINRDTKTIQAICYGAGYDRAVSYSDVVRQYYTIYRDFNKCTSDNSVATVMANATYTETLTADEGYSLDGVSISVTMGGVDVTDSVYNNGVITIPSVTGDIVITAYSRPSVGYTNQIPISTDSTGAIYNGTGYKDGVRIGSDGTDRTGAATDATGFIPITIGDKLYFRNCEILQTGTGTDIYNHIVCYDSNKVRVGAIYLQNDISSMYTYTKDGNNNLTMLDTASFAGNNANAAFVRIAGNYIGADSVITKNQPIE